jgi:hypothetical protein
LAENNKKLLDGNFILDADTEVRFASMYTERQVDMSKKMLVATVAAVAMTTAAHADISHTRFFSCTPAFTWNEADPVVEVDASMEITQRPNGNTSQIRWSIVHRTQHGAAFFREQQYGDRRWVQPNFSRPLWQWTGHLLKDYAVFVTGELEDHGRGNITYKEYWRCKCGSDNSLVSWRRKRGHYY